MDNSLILQAKDVSIVSYLYSKNILPDQFSQGARNDYAYRSPITRERTASFFVNSRKNVWRDYSANESGDSIRLALLLEKCTFIEAVQRLLAVDGQMPVQTVESPAAANSEPTEAKQIVTDIRTLKHVALIQYLDSRGITYEVARRFVKQIHYSFKGKEYFGIGFHTDAGGWVIRSRSFKGNAGPTGITTIAAESNKVLLFEGFMDFLSANAYGIKTNRHTSIILNSTANLTKPIIEKIKGRTTYAFLDNDEAGRAAVGKLIKSGCDVDNTSSALYPNYKDFNDFLVNAYSIK